MKSKFCSGYTVLELLVSTAIIGLVASTLANCMINSIGQGGQTQDIAKSADLAQRYVETVKSELYYTMNYDSATEGTSPPVDITSDFTNNGYFSVNTNITDLEYETDDYGTLIPVLKELDVEFVRVSDSLSMINISTLISRQR